MAKDQGSTVKDDEQYPTRVLIALDDSDEAVRATRAAVRLFSAGAEFLVLNVGNPRGFVGYDGAVVAPYGLVVPMAARWGMVGPGPGVLEGGVPEPSLPDGREVEERARRLGVPDPHAITDIGDPVEAICAAADEHDVDVIVVGAHDKGFLRRMIDPSVSAGVVRSTARPVLVVSGGDTT